MLKPVSALMLCVFASFSAYAANPDCESKAAEKKLAGAAKSSFIKKCEKDAASPAASDARLQCEAKAADKKLKGAAKNSFLKKCEKDAAAPAK